MPREVLNEAIQVGNSSYVEEFVYKAYRYRQIKIAETLIKAGGTFEVKNLFLLNEFSCAHKYHLEQIKDHLSLVQYESGINLVSAYGCSVELDKVNLNTNYQCINLSQYLTDHTVSNMGNKSFVRNLYDYTLSFGSNIVKDILNGLSNTALSIMDLIRKYWEEFIAPKVQDYTNGTNFCLDNIHEVYPTGGVVNDQ